MAGIGRKLRQDSPIADSEALQWHLARLGSGPAGPPAIGEETAVNDETVVNTTTAGDQYWSSSAALANGGFVIVWEDLDADTLRFRRYDADGNASGQVTMPLTSEPGSPIEPVVTGLSDGGFVIAWNSGFNSSSTGDDDVRAQRFDADGVAVGEPFTVNAANGIADFAVTITTLADGGFAIAWQGQGQGILVRHYDATGTALGGPEAASVTTHSIITQSRVAGLEGGGSIVVWAVADLAGGAAPGAILGRRFDASGNPVGGEFEVTPIDGNTDGGVEIAALEGGGFVVVWSSSDPDQIVHILAQRFDASGTPVGGELELYATAPGGSVGQASLSPLPGGGFVAAWNEVGANDIILARAFDASGVPYDEAFIVNQGADPDVILLESAVSTLADGSVVIAWGEGDIVYRRFAIDTGVVPPIVGTAGPDVLTGTEGDDVIQGLSGNDRIDGKRGVDRLEGGPGDDIYLVDNAGDLVVELGGEGRDTVYSYVDYVLAAGSAVEVLSTISHGATTPLRLTGNALFQDVVGNAGANILDGGGGNDILQGLGGDDTYLVDEAGVRTIELAGSGNDQVLTSVSYQLAFNASIETLAARDAAATTALVLTGNNLAQTITGNAGANVLNGKGGADTLQGLGGNDVYYIDFASVIVQETAGGGTDIIYTSVSYTLPEAAQVEILSTVSHGSTSAIDLTGNGGHDAIYGNAGANRLDGKAGIDTLIGFGGADVFAFSSALGSGNVDFIRDMAIGVDRIALDDAIFTQLGLALNANAFVTGTAATDADDRIIYNSATGQLFYDADGNGGGFQILFAILQNQAPVSAGDFMVI